MREGAWFYVLTVVMRTLMILFTVPTVECAWRGGRA
jgi:hypothetical protein